MISGVSRQGVKVETLSGCRSCTYKDTAGNYIDPMKFEEK